jgi:hypothetical protein
MHSEQIHKAWWNYLKDMLDPRTTDQPSELPYLFSEPHCATCFHWFLVNEHGLHHLADTSSTREYDGIIEDLSGKRICAYREEGEIKDTYRDYRFYGWCRRFPPSQRSGYPVIGFRSLFTFLSRHIPRRISEYDFPLMPHNCSCGEWKEDRWVADFVGEHRGNAQLHASEGHS